MQSGVLSDNYLGRRGAIFGRRQGNYCAQEEARTQVGTCETTKNVKKKKTGLYFRHFRLILSHNKTTDS